MTAVVQWFKSLVCEHAWERSGSAYDSRVRCPHCGTEKDEEPGDVASH